MRHPRRQPFHHLAAAAELLHELARLSELAQQAVDVLDPGAAAARDALAAAAVDHRRLATLLRRHRIDDRGRPLHLPLAGLGVHLLGRLAQARDHPQHLVEGSHLLHLGELLPVVVEGQLAAAEAVDHGLRLLTVDRLLHLLDETQHVPQAEDPPHHALGLEGLELLDLLSHPGELDGGAGDGGRGESGATAGVAVELGEHDARDADPLLELLRAAHRVLPGHGVGDVEDLARLGERLQLVQLRHQLVVDVETAGGVDQHELVAHRPRAARRARRDGGP